jgi:P-type Cu2+ transporter
MKTEVRKAKPATETFTFPVLGMTCGGCAVSVEETLAAQPGVVQVAVNYANQTAQIQFDPQQVRADGLQKALQSVGYDLILDQDNGEAQQAEAQQADFRRLTQRLVWAGALSLPVFGLGMFLMDEPWAKWVSWVLSTPVIFWFGRSFFINAYKKARHRQANMDTLVALSTGIAYLFSVFNTLFPAWWHARGLHAHVYFESAAIVVAFILLGKWLEERAKAQTSSALKKLAGLQPSTVWVGALGQEREVPLAEVAPGMEVLVRPGDKIAVDGVVVQGHSLVDESLISGEPVPVEKSAGQPVFAGTLNQQGSFRFRAEQVGSQTRLAQIIRLVKQAQGSKAPVQQLVDKVAGIFVPVVLLIALLTLVGWLIFGGENALTLALLNTVTVLCIACPCALGLATPTAIMVGVGKGAELGILVKDAASLELAHRVGAVVLDKTGTLTKGKPEVLATAWLPGSGPDLLRDWQAALLGLEIQSGHPLAGAVVAYLQAQGHQPAALAAFANFTGAGVSAQAHGHTYRAGREGWLRSLGGQTPPELAAQAAQWQAQGHTVVYFAQDDQTVGILAVADALKETSAQAVRDLQRAGIEVYLLTGDQAQTAAQVAQQVGIAQFRAEMLPADKAAFVQQLQAQGKVVAMVGDGLNDSPALAQADVSMAMGQGADLAMELASLTLVSSDLRLVARALRLSRLTVRAIWQNLFWAFIYNLAGIPVAAGLLYPVNGFLLDPMLAGAAMALSSVSVVGNSLRLKHQPV